MSSTTAPTTTNPRPARLVRPSGRVVRTKGPKLMAAVNGPGFTPAKPTRGMPKAAERITTTAMAAPYDGAELRPVAGLTPDRLEAFSLPSRIGNRLHYSDGRVELVNGGKA